MILKWVYIESKMKAAFVPTIKLSVTVVFLKLGTYKIAHKYVSWSQKHLINC